MHGNILQCFTYLEKVLKVTESFFFFEREEKFVFFHFQRVFLLNFHYQVNVKKVMNDEVSKNVRDHQKIIGMPRNYLN